MEILSNRLEKFNFAMLSKFLAVEKKHRGQSVVDNSVDWDSFDWKAIEEHFWEEVEEVKVRPADAREYVDIANMAFLLWWRLLRSESRRVEEVD